MQPELVEVRRWLEKAAHDRRTTLAALRDTPPITDTAAFHVQQAAEKILKAYLTWKRAPFEKTHDLRTLIEHCAQHDVGFLQYRDSIGPLTAFAVRFRYPGPADPTLKDVQEGLANVDLLLAFVQSRLPREVGI